MAWLERQQGPFELGTPDPATALAVRAWKWMGGRIDWAGLPLVAELLGIEELETLIVQLAALRDWQQRKP